MLKGHWITKDATVI